MGCDIHSFAEVKTDGKWIKIEDKIFSQKKGEGTSTEPFETRNYGVFGFLADVRNYSHIPTLIPLRGLPNDSEYLNSARKYGETTRLREIADDFDYHSCGYIFLTELLGFNYDETFEDRRYTKQTGPNSYDGAAECEPGQGKVISFRDFLGSSFSTNLDILTKLGNPENTRVVFYFDN